MVLSSLLPKHGSGCGNVIVDFSNFVIWQKTFHTGIEPPTSWFTIHGHILCATETWKMMRVESVESVESERPLLEKILYCVLQPLTFVLKTGNVIFYFLEFR